VEMFIVKSTGIICLPQKKESRISSSYLESGNSSKQISLADDCSNTQQDRNWQKNMSRAASLLTQAIKKSSPSIFPAVSDAQKKKKKDSKRINLLPLIPESDLELESPRKMN
jgi:hypothetical protein